MAGRRTTVASRITQRFREEMEEFARTHDTTVSHLIETAVREYMDRDSDRLLDDDGLFHNDAVDKPGGE